MKDITKKTLVLCTLTSLVAGCTSTTVLHSRPEGAKVYLANIYKGTTPYTNQDLKIVGATTPLRLTMEGYQPLDTSLTKDEKVNVGAVVGGVFFLFPFLWTEGYLPEHTYDLAPIATPAAK